MPHSQIHLDSQVLALIYHAIDTWTRTQLLQVYLKTLVQLTLVGMISFWRTAVGLFLIAFLYLITCLERYEDIRAQAMRGAILGDLALEEQRQ